MKKGFLSVGHLPTLFASFFYFDMSFMVWVLIPLAVALAVFSVLARNSPKAPAPQKRADYLRVLKISDAWWFMFLYSVTFGGFVGLSSLLTVYFNDQYGLSPVVAGYFTAASVFVGSFMRPVGGAFADRVGGVFSLSIMYTIAAGALALISLGVWSAPVALLVFMVAMLALGMGNGAVFQLIPQSFSSEIGVITGLVGMAGGIGGLFLASRPGIAKPRTRSYPPGLPVFGLLAPGALRPLTRRESP